MYPWCCRFFSVLPGFSWCDQKSQNWAPPQLEGNLPISFNSLFDKKNGNLKGSELKQLCEEMFQELRVMEEAGYLLQATIKQFLTWHKYRQGQITTSHFHHIYKHITYTSTSIVNRIKQYYSNMDNVNALKWGRENKDRRCQEYTYLLYGREVWQLHTSTCVHSKSLETTIHYFTHCFQASFPIPFPSILSLFFFPSYLCTWLQTWSLNASLLSNSES